MNASRAKGESSAPSTPVRAWIVEAGDVENSEWATVSHAAIIKFETEADLDAAIAGAPIVIEWPQRKRKSSSAEGGK